MWRRKWNWINEKCCGCSLRFVLIFKKITYFIFSNFAHGSVQKIIFYFVSVHLNFRKPLKFLFVVWKFQFQHALHHLDSNFQFLLWGRLQKTSNIFFWDGKSEPVWQPHTKRKFRYENFVTGGRLKIHFFMEVIWERPLYGTCKSIGYYFLVTISINNFLQAVCFPYYYAFQGD